MTSVLGERARFTPGGPDLSLPSYFSSGEPIQEERELKKYIHQVAAADKSYSPAFSDDMHGLRQIVEP